MFPDPNYYDDRHYGYSRVYISVRGVQYYSLLTRRMIHKLTNYIISGIINLTILQHSCVFHYLENLTGAWKPVRLHQCLQPLMRYGGGAPALTYTAKANDRKLYATIADQSHLGMFLMPWSRNQLLRYRVATEMDKLYHRISIGKLFL